MQKILDFQKMQFGEETISFVSTSSVGCVEGDDSFDSTCSVSCGATCG